MTEEIESDASMDLRVIRLVRVLTLSVWPLWSGNVRLTGGGAGPDTGGCRAQGGAGSGQAVAPPSPRTSAPESASARA